MNERIENLLYHSGLTASGCWEKFDDYDKDAMNKFAQLIVNECMRVCIADLADPRDSVELQCAKRIQEHFGAVE